ncbi:MAG: hypothetical protein A2845_02015 [Candidatus Lloydbacteria bacterium RIFCSPHIGHO2_01_FULL_49_22]|uniref:Uncharacterized protein n=1 Tax=Candidatus Lloydbacteria bacterium RIFCSPHIGHO2_01_FULL_49_22 TaxID=1798658 RepID=A0A1G2CUY3_9BACT|nr:MAG: hypothetical protein A2845_02015 [Candidatus Lloydbacteria bacterium RIFCSPHIGHO2_01_FULL_49_22]OGZ09618.1 MAG: hypothetical protein A3C14_05990 [Candidatus Lloydbacteria bacterium RIFCSPHIGHO2_02_FULL_50_18]
MTSLLFPSGVIIIFLGALILFLLGLFVGYGTKQLKGAHSVACILIGLILSYLYYLVVIDLVFR